MKYKLICSDIDGTLLNKDRELSPLTIEQIARLKNQIPFILVSSRMPTSMRQLQSTLDINPSPLICYNGGLVIDQDNQTLLSESIPMEVLEFLYHRQFADEVNLSLYCFDEWFVERFDYWTNREIHNTKVHPIQRSVSDSILDFRQRAISPHKIMCMGEERFIDQIEDTLTSNHSSDIHLYRAKTTYLEIASKKTSKAKALKVLLEKKYDFEADQVIAFGDNYNDIDLLEFVGLGIAVKNAKKEVLEIAQEITLSNVEDGVAVYLREFFG